VSAERFVHTAYIGLGSNLGDSRQLLGGAWKTLAIHPEVETTTLSSPYLTKPVDMETTNWFVNAVGKLSTTLSPHGVLQLLLEVEKEYGRIRTPEIIGHEDRTLDLDLLLYDSLALTDSDLIIPHPEMEKRLFVLAPLAEISPEAEHPVFQQTVARLLEAFPGWMHSKEIIRDVW